MDLLGSDSEDEVIALLKNAGLWEDSNLWRLYGDKEGNFAQAGNQQALPEAALVEKLVIIGSECKQSDLHSLTTIPYMLCS